MSTDPGAKFLDGVLGIVTWIFFTTPLLALLAAWSFDTIWSWYLQPELGEGLTLRSWFGIGWFLAITLDLRVAQLLIALQKDTEEKSFVLGVLKRAFTEAMLILLVLGMAGITKWMAGW